MKVLPAVAVLLVVTAAASSPWWLAPPAPRTDASAHASRGAPTDDRDGANAASGEVARDHAPAPTNDPGSAPAAPPREPTPPREGTHDAATTTAAARIAWPVAPRSRDGKHSSPAGATGTPAVAAELAFTALRFVGIDPAAEGVWRRAIDDAAMPAGTRSDLIEDLNQEGYIDNSRPTKDDLPLIRARLRLIERLAPHARDDVNAAAFAEAYKDLLAMYVRLAGERPGGR